MTLLNEEPAVADAAAPEPLPDDALSSDDGRDAPGKPMRIAVIGGRGLPSNYSGIERIWSELYPIIASRGHRVTCYCRPGVLGQERGEHRGVRLVTTPAPGGRSAETLTHSYTALRHALRRGDVHDGGKPFDLIALHALPPQWFSAMPRRWRVPLVSHVHGIDWQRQKWKDTPLAVGSRIIRHAERRMVRHADAVAACASNLVDYYKAAYGRVAHFTPNGVLVRPDDAPPHEPTLEKFGLAPEQFVVCVGRLVPEKRVEDAIAGFLAFADSFPRHKLVIVGEGLPGAYLDGLHNLASDRVIFTGLQSGDALETLFRHAAAYVTASELEGLPSSLLECMEYATPAVASSIAPHRQLLDDVEGYDLFFRVGDVGGLGRQLARVLSSPRHGRAVGLAQRRHVRAEYAWPAPAKRIERLYADVIAGRVRESAA